MKVLGFGLCILLLSGCVSTQNSPDSDYAPEISSNTDNSLVQKPVLSCQRPQGHHLYNKEFSCPLGGEKFQSLVLGTHSTYGLYLDWEPVSYLSFPAPLPVCPSNGFVIYKEDFSSAELDNLEKAITSDAYKADFNDYNTSYFLFGRLIELSGNTEDYDLWWVYLRSTWEADMCGSDKYSKYALRTIEVAQNALPSLTEKDIPYWIINIIVPNLYRRMGDFDSAQQWLSDMEGIRPSTELESAEFYNLAFSLLEEAIRAKSTEQIQIKKNEE